jgi:hypothetical protein
MSQYNVNSDASGTTNVETLTGNSGGAVSPSGGNINTVGTGSITIVGNPGTSTLTTQLTGLTNHNVLVGAGTATITSVSPSTAGFILTSNGVTSDPSFQTASASGAVTTLNADSGSATPSSGAIKISGGSTGLTTTGSGSTINLTGTLDVANGGTGLASTTAYAVLCGGTSSTGALQPIAGVGTSGQILTSNGAGALPTFQAAPSGGITTIDGNSGSVTGSTITISTPASSGTLNFSGSSTTLTLNLYDGSDNFALGASATSTGGNAIAIGHSAGASALNSIVIGTNAADAAGPNNITIGNAATNGTFAASPSNVVIGHSASASGTANASIAIGDSANAGSAGSSIVIGQGASAVGGSNVVMGSGVVDNGAGASVIIGDDAKGCSGGYNIILGYSAGSSNTTGGSNITISNVGSSGESNVTRIGTSGTGNGQQSKCFIAGIAGVTVTGSVVLCSSSGQLGDISSSITVKENVKDIGDVSILKFAPGKIQLYLR